MYSCMMAINSMKRFCLFIVLLPLATSSGVWDFAESDFYEPETPFRYDRRLRVNMREILCRPPNLCSLDLRYTYTPGVPKNFQTLDVYQPPANAKQTKRMVMYVHGGKWAVGDKNNKIEDKVSYFRDQLGYIFVSVNYRLVTETNNVMYPDFAIDVAAAIAYSLEKFNLDSLSLIGHSAGAHLVSLVSTDPSYLAGHNLDLSSINFVAPLDTEAFDVAAKGGPTYAFGNNLAIWEEASPITHVDRNLVGNIPPHLLVTRGTAKRREIVEEYTEALERAGVPVFVFDASPLSHEEITGVIGNPRDTFVTPAIYKMLVRYNPPK